ncbi:MAG: hypothetical protein IKO72_07770, partial [Kiritimatiellae bacterium]|nr:hypothetical protein [Kiritimatiellia bacterium]
DSCLRYDGSGNIVGRNGGIKAWLSENVPELYPRYKTIMRYKALAMRLRQAMGVKDPEPTSALFGEAGSNGAAPGVADMDGVGATAAESAETQKQMAGGKGGEEVGNENYSALKSHLTGGGEESGDGDGNDCGGIHGNENDGRRGDGGGDYGGRDDGHRRRGRLGLAHMRRRCNRRKERLRQLLDGCGNTFKDVLARIDAELDRVCSG